MLLDQLTRNEPRIFQQVTVIVTSMAEVERTRLHISPFNSSLFDTIVPKSVQSAATGISYHTIQTFPDRGFGFVELPKLEADKLRKKLNGMTLKGAKMRVEEAKPEKRKRVEAANEEVEAEVEEKPKKRSKKLKSKKKDGEIEGFEMPADRHVKRGWTEESGKKERSKEKSDDKKAKKRETSKYIKGKEVLFKTTLPHHSTPVADAPAITTATAPATKDKKDKKAKYAKGPTVIHEFERTHKHASFLRSEATSKNGIATDYVDGKGWIDADGNVVEAVKVQPKREDRLALIPEVPVKLQTGERASAIMDAINPSGRPRKNVATEVDNEAKADSDNESTSSAEEVSSVSSESSEELSEDEPSSESEEENEASEDEQVPQSQPAVLQNDMKLDTTARAETSPSPPADSANPSTPSKEVHPLEALFKRAKATGTPRPAPINTSFSFFDADNDDVDEQNDTVNDMIPQTPFSRTRDIRSAAPTPDTAAIGKKFSFFHDIDEEDADEGAYIPQSEYADQDTEMGGWVEGDEEDVNRIPVTKKAKEEGAGTEETDFAKWFWENRGDTNRAWKKRRREVLKVKRQRENRRLGRKVV